MRRIGYMRVSTVIQNTDRQLVGIELDEVFTDKLSGKDMNRPQLQACLASLQPGDTLFVHSMDRLARNLKDMLDIIESLRAKNVSIEFVKDRLSYAADTSPMTMFGLHIMGAFAQMERSLIRERQREGIAIAKQNGVYKGRQRKLTPEQAQELKTLAEKGIAKSTLAEKFGIARCRVYSYL